MNLTSLRQALHPQQSLPSLSIGLTTGAIGVIFDVVVRAINTCRQESFLGIPAHHRQQQFMATFIHHITNGKIVETWRNADDLGRLLQLGARIEPGSQNV